jgi:hypothetical protein
VYSKRTGCIQDISEEAMEREEEIDQFKMLEEKIEALILHLTALKKENHSLDEKVRVQEEKISALGKEVEIFKKTRDEARKRVISLLEKLNDLEF